MPNDIIYPHELPIAGLSVSQCLVDYTFSLRFMKPGSGLSSDDDALLQIGTPFDFAVGTAIHRCDVERDPTTAGPALALFNRILLSAEVGDDAVLRLMFDEHTTISVPSDTNYEAWTLAGPHKLLVVCMPGGELAVFSDTEAGR